MQGFKRAGTALKVGLALVVGFLAGDYTGKGFLYRRACGLWYDRRPRARTMPESPPGEPESAVSHVPVGLYLTDADEMENRLYGLYPSAHIRLMDPNYYSIAEYAIQRAWESRAASNNVNRSPWRYVGDCDERASILRGFLEQKYPGAAIGLVSGNLKTGQSHVELLFWSKNGFATFDPSTGSRHNLTNRFASVRLIVM